MATKINNVVDVLEGMIAPDGRRIGVWPYSLSVEDAMKVAIGDKLLDGEVVGIRPGEDDDGNEIRIVSIRHPDEEVHDPR